MASYYTYIGTDFNNIYASNSADLYYNKTVPGFQTNSVLRTYNGTNGSSTQQGNISYTYLTGTTVTNYSNGLQAYYQEFRSPGNTALEIPVFCNKLAVFLVGAGGSGGAGGGDVPGKSGTNGAGGGGGAYVYGLVTLSDYAFSKIGWMVNVGSGGASVSGSATGDNNGSNGNPGGPTILKKGTTVILTANGGGGGGGGHPSSPATPGLGGSVSNSGPILSGFTAGDALQGTNAIFGGYSGYTRFENAGIFDIYPKPYLPSMDYGNGGNGTGGRGDPNTDPTGPGLNGYARIYFMV